MTIKLNGRCLRFLVLNPPKSRPRVANTINIFKQMFYNAQCGILCMIKFNTTQEAPKYTLDDHPCGTRNNEGITVCVVRNVDDYGCCWQQRERRNMYISAAARALKRLKKTMKKNRQNLLNFEFSERSSFLSRF